jgi:hypothetical protein
VPRSRASRSRCSGKIARERPQFLIHAVLGGFLLKAFAMLVTTLAIRFVPALDEAFDAVGYLIAFAVTAIGILVPATLDTLRLVGVRTRSSSECSDSDQDSARGVHACECRALTLLIALLIVVPAWLANPLRSAPRVGSVRIRSCRCSST